MSFYDLDTEIQARLLLSRRGLGPCIKSTSGFSGKIIIFQGDSIANCCAKFPLTKNNVEPKEAAKRFLREIKIQREMYYHEFVHWAFDFDVILDAPIAWFRYWHCDLADLIENRHFTIIGRLVFLLYLTEALDHCHNRSMCAHQDLKPENIFVRNYRKDFHDLPTEDVWVIPKLADFGSVNLASEIGEFGGTRPYMAPEQWARQPLGRHTSVWSLGVIGYELLSFGEHPIGEKTAPWRRKESGVFNRWQKNEMWRRWVQNDRCQPATTLSDPEIQVFINQCLEVDVSRRPSLRKVYENLLSLIQRRCLRAAEQAEFRVAYAKAKSRCEHDWPYIDKRFNQMVDKIANIFADPSISKEFNLATEN